jgi:hypothetical protein
MRGMKPIKSVQAMLETYDSWLTPSSFHRLWEVVHDRLPDYHATESELKEMARVIELYGKFYKYGMSKDTTIQ